MGGSGKVKLNVANGKIRIFVTGNITLGTSVEAIILNGDCKNVYWETHGDFNLGGSSKWYGTTYCPSEKLQQGQVVLLKVPYGQMVISILVEVVKYTE